MDLVIQLSRENIERAFAALAALGYEPLVPVTVAQFSDATVRERWIREKGMKVLQFRPDAHRATPGDFFAEEPFEFEEGYRRALVERLERIEVRFVSAATLVRMKEAADRPQDRIDAGHLRMRMESGGSG